MTDEARIRAQRAEIEQLASGRTFCDLLAATASTHADVPAYSDTWTDGGEWQTITWGQTWELALTVASGFIALGLQPGERVGMMLPNCTRARTVRPGRDARGRRPGDLLRHPGLRADRVRRGQL